MLNVECSMTGPPFNIQHSAFNIREAFWWAWVDSNYRPHAYQACALTN